MNIVNVLAITSLLVQWLNKEESFGTEIRDTEVRVVFSFSLLFRVVTGCIEVEIEIWSSRR